MWLANRIKRNDTCALALIALVLGSQGHVSIAQTPVATFTSPATQPLAPGDLIVSGFSGSKLAGDGGIAPGVDPVEKTIIDVGAPSLRAFGIESVGGAPAGQVVNPHVKFDVKARDIGQVFGLALDDATGSPSLFTAATSAFGLHIVAGAADKDGTPIRLKAGAPGAQFMTGQFGGMPGAGPGSVYKIDVATGAATVFANTDAGGIVNSGAGLAGPAIDGKSRSLFVADLDTGVIHRFALDRGGSSTATFDHGKDGRPAAGKAAVADDGKRLDLASPSFRPDEPATWGLTAPVRRVTALAVRDSRLYYAVAEGTEVWSVGINADGTFGADARLEVTLKADKPSTITSIAFDKDGRLVAGLRGIVKSPFDFGKFVDPDSGRVVRFTAKTSNGAASGGNWASEVEEFSVGGAEGHSSASGGVGHGHAFASDGSIDLAQCSGALIASGDTLSNASSDDAVSHGVQLNTASLAKPANTPPSQSVFVDFDGRLGNVNERGHVGAVLGIQDCSGNAGGPQVEGPPVAEGGPPVEGGGPPVAGGGPPIAGGGGGGGPPVAEGEEAPPVEDAPPVEEAAVDPNAPNMAVEKTQQCTVTGTKGTCVYTITARNTGATPFDASGVVFNDDFVQGTPEVETPDGITKTPTGATLAFPPGTMVPPGNATDGGPKFPALKATFDVPPGGTIIENCASLTFPAAGADTSTTAPADGLSVKNVNTPTCTDNPDGITKKCRFPVALENNSGASVSQFIKFRTEPPPEKGFTNESPGIGSGIRGDGTWFRGAQEVAAGETGTPVVFSADYPIGQAPIAQPSVDRAPRVLRTGEATCQPPQDGEQVCSVPLKFENPSQLANPKIEILSNTAPKRAMITKGDQTIVPTGSKNVGATITSFDTSFPANSKEDLVATIVLPEGTNKSFDVRVADESTAAADKLDQEPAAAATPGSTNAGATTAPTQDSDPSDDTSCIAFDTNAPDDQGTPTNAPSQALPTLAITKSPTVPTCGKGEARSEWRCGWTVNIKNIGTSPITEPIVFADDTSFPTSTAIVSGGGHVCELNGGAASPSRSCQVATGAGLQPNESIELSLDSSIPFSAVPVDTPPGECKITNTVRIVSPVGAGEAPSAEATATLEPGENKGGKIPCDPPSLSLSKTAKSCAASGDGLDCGFSIVVTSTGPDPFQNGVIDIVEAVPDGATLKTGSQGWSCAPAGGMFHCHHGAVTLAVGETLALDVSLQVPKSTLAPGQCDIKNEAQIVELGRGNTSSQSQYRASATAKIDSPECNRKVAEPPKPLCLAGYVGEYPNCCRPPLRFDPVVGGCAMPEMTCFGGMTLVSASGKCACPDGKHYNVQRGSCMAPPTTTCLPGQYYSDGVCYDRAASVEDEAPTGGTNPTVADNPKPCADGSIKKRGKACPSPKTEPLRGGTNSASDDGSPSCSGSRPVGTYPNCCPVNTIFVKGVCRRWNGGPKQTGGSNPTLNINEPRSCPANTRRTRSNGRVVCAPIVANPNVKIIQRSIKTAPAKQTGGINQSLPGTNVNQPRRIGRSIKNSEPPRHIGKAMKTPDKRVNYGAFSGQGKPPVDKGAPR